MARKSGALRDKFPLSASGITQWKQAEEALWRNEERFRNVLENSLDMIYRLSLETDTYDYVSPSSRQVIGYSPEELIALGIERARSLAHPDDIQRLDENVIQLLTQAPEQGVPHGIEYRIKHKDLGYRWVSDTRSVVRDDRNIPVAVVGNLRDITERKRAEEALQASAQQWEATFNAVSDVVSLMDTEGRIMQCNDAMSNLLGKPSSGIIGSTCWELMHGASEPIEGCPIVRMRRTRRRESLVLPIADRWFEISVDPLLDGSGALMGAVHIMTDITERKRAEEALQKQTHDLGERVKELNCLYRASRLTAEPDWSYDEVLQGIADLIPPSWKYPEVTCARISLGGREYKTDNFNNTAWKQSAAIEVFGEEVGSVEVCYLQEKPAAHEGPFLKEERDLIDGLASQIRRFTERKQAEEELVKYHEHLEELVDERTAELSKANEQLQQEITERKKTDEALRAKEEYFRALMENSQDAMIVLNGDGSMRDVSTSIENVTGYKVRDLKAVKPFEFVHRDDLANVTEIFARLVQNPGAIERSELCYRHKDGSWHHAEVIGQNLLDDPAVGGIVVNFRDVTERKRAQEKLERLYKKEKRLHHELEEEMKKRIEFTRALAHELKTPLTPVVISSQTLVSQLQEGPLLSLEPLMRLATNISRGASNLNSRIDELLDLARGEMGMLKLKTEPIDALSLLREMMDEVATVASNQGQSLVSRLPHSLPLISADRTRLKQIVLNLLNNAFKFTPHGGRITLRAKEDDGNLTIEVKNSGPGISKEEQEELFKPYHRIEHDRERLSGLGLGLALCRTLVELHGGRIWVKSSVGKGSTFGFSLPLESSAGEQETLTVGEE